MSSTMSTSMGSKTFFAVILLSCVLPFVALYDDLWINVVETFKKAPNGEICEKASYTMRFISYEPLIMHIEDFITPREREHLLKIGAPLAQRSTVQQRNGTKLYSSTRTSSSGFIPKNDPVSQCISQRAAELQGYEDLESVEGLQITAYSESQEYREHFDWYGRRMNMTSDRVTTIFGILDADCDNCGTRFPKIPVEWDSEDERWCRIVDCSSDDLVVNPLPGSALFWRNLHDDGSGDRRMLHAGMPLTRGHKTGLNIWTRQPVS